MRTHFGLFFVFFLQSLPVLADAVKTVELQSTINRQIEDALKSVLPQESFLVATHINLRRKTYKDEVKNESLTKHNKNAPQKKQGLPGFESPFWSEQGSEFTEEKKSTYSLSHEWVIDSAEIRLLFDQKLSKAEVKNGQNIVRQIVKIAVPVSAKLSFEKVSFRSKPWFLEFDFLKTLAPHILLLCGALLLAILFMVGKVIQGLLGATLPARQVKGRSGGQGGQAQQVGRSSPGNLTQSALSSRGGAMSGRGAYPSAANAVAAIQALIDNLAANPERSLSFLQALNQEDRNAVVAAFHLKPARDLMARILGQSLAGSGSPTPEQSARLELISAEMSSFTKMAGFEADKRFGFLAFMPRESLWVQLDQLSDDEIAILVRYVQLDNIAAYIRKLPDARKERIIECAAISNPPEANLVAFEERLRAQVDAQQTDVVREILPDLLPKLGNISSPLSKLMHKDSVTFSPYASFMITFPKLLAEVKGREFEAIVNRVDNRTLALALHKLEPAMANAFLSALSLGRSELITGLMRSFQNLSAEESEASQEEIMRIFRSLRQQAQLRRSQRA